MIISHIAESIDRGIYTQFESIDFSNDIKIKRYDKKINYQCGMTDHYENSRIFRENELLNILGPGKRIDAFFVDKGNGDKQIHELLHNGIMVVYSYETHKKITIFAVHPERICSLYISIGEFPPKVLMNVSEYNVRRGYNEIMRD